MSSKMEVIEVIMTTVSPLYTGEVREQEKKLAKVNFPVRKTATGKVQIQFKGPLRSALEILLRAKGEDVCDTGAKAARPCGHCTTCSLFGSMGVKGRINVEFLVSEKDVNESRGERYQVRQNAKQHGHITLNFFPAKCSIKDHVGPKCMS